MPVISDTGLFTSLLELTATAIGSGVVFGGFLAAAAGANWAVTKAGGPKSPERCILGGVIGISCLSADLIVRCAQWW
jgi:hypothetical protein